MSKSANAWLAVAAEGIAGLTRMAAQISTLCDLQRRSTEALERVERLIREATDGMYGPAIDVVKLPPRDWAPGEIARTMAEGDASGPEAAAIALSQAACEKPLDKAAEPSV